MNKAVITSQALFQHFFKNFSGWFADRYAIQILPYTLLEYKGVVQIIIIPDKTNVLCLEGLSEL